VGAGAGAGIEKLSDSAEVVPFGVVATMRRVWVPAAAERVVTRLVELEAVATSVPSRYACNFFVRLVLVASTRNGDATELPAPGELIVTVAWAAHKDRAMHISVRLNKSENSEFLMWSSLSSGREAQQIVRATQLKLTASSQPARRERIGQNLRQTARWERVGPKKDVAPRSHGVSPMG
jgi:hypothetical protein